MRPSPSLALLFLASAAVFGQGNITTIAGTNVCGFSGDSGPAAEAIVCNPRGVIVDPTGRTYFVDATNWRIRKIDSGVITTIAGNGVPGDFGNSIGAVTHLTYSPYNDIFFSDPDAHKISWVGSYGGPISRLGTGAPVSAGDGGAAMNASFNQPSGIVLYSEGSTALAGLYVADAVDGLVRKVPENGSAVSTIVGPGTGALGDGGPGTAASLLSPGGLAIFNNVLYIADTGHHRIRKLDLSTGIITTYAGNGVPGFGGDGGAATSALLQRADTPSFDPNGNLYVTDAGNFRVRKIDATGTISTYAGNGISAPGADNIPPTQTSFLSINGASWDPIRNAVQIADGSHRVRLADPRLSSTTSLNLTPIAGPGHSFTLAATVSPSTASGTVTFEILIPGYWTDTLGPIPVNSGQASTAWNPPGSQEYTITTIYSGDATYLPNTITTAVVVPKGSTSTTLSSSSNPSNPGGTVTFTANVTPSEAFGTINFYGSYQGGTAELLGSVSAEGGVAQLTTNSLQSGWTSVTAEYDGFDTWYSASNSSPLTQQVRTATTISLSDTLSPTVPGAPVTLTAVVTPSGAIGTVQFYDSSTLLGTANTLPYSIQVSNLSVGTHSLTASFVESDQYLASTSTPRQHVINPAASTTTLSPSSTTPALGQPVILTATVAPAATTGNVNFYQGATLLGTTALTGGQATLSWTSAGAGSFSVTATYDGNASYNPSTSSATEITVQKAASTTNLTSSLNPSVVGGAVTFTATVTPATASGTVLFTSTGASGNITLGTVTLVSGVASINSSSLPAGVSNITAQYSGNANYNASSSTPVAQTVKAVTTTTFTTTPSSSTYGQSVTLRATISPSNSTGTVQFFQGATLVGTASVSAGIAQLVTTSLPTGTLSLTASYSGNATNAASTSAPKSFVVAKANTTTTLSANPSSSRFGQNVTFTATVAPSAATGTVEFRDGSTVLATVPVSNGTAVFSTSSLSIATHSMRAVYSGGSNHNTSQSSILNYKVKP